MAKIRDSLINLDSYIDSGTFSAEPPQRAELEADLQPGLNPMMKCPLPPVTVSPDSLRQYYRGGILPQIRVLSPSNPSINGALGGSSGNVISSSSSTETIELTVQQTSIVTNILNPGDIFTGIVNLGKVFQLLQISSNVSARIELYNTLNNLQLDTIRALDVAPAFGTTEGIIVDLALDQAPFSFSLEDISGNNGDNPQVSLAYVAITNIGQATTPIVVTLSYVTLVT